MRLRKSLIILLSLTATLALSGCSTTQRNSAQSEIKADVPTKTEVNYTNESDGDNHKSMAEKYKTYKDINQGKPAEVIYQRYILGIKNNPNYGSDTLENESLAIVLYKPNCPDCRQAEEAIVQKVKEGASYASTSMQAGGVERYKYNVVAVDISKKVPQWIKDIHGLADESNEYHTPTVAVVTPKKVNSDLYWDMMGRYTGTDRESIRNVLQYYGLEKMQAYKVFMETQPTVSEENRVK